MPATGSAVCRVERGDGVGVARSDVMRDVAKRFLRKQAVVGIDVLSDASVQAILDECLDEAAVSLGTKRPLPPTSADAVPEAWLPDPTGRHDVRWWNGHSWTDQVSDAGVRSIDPLV